MTNEMQARPKGLPNRKQSILLVRISISISSIGFKGVYKGLVEELNLVILIILKLLLRRHKYRVDRE